VKFVLPGHTAAVTSAAISPDGRRAVTGSQDGIAKLWDLETGKEVLSLKRHAAELTSVHFSPDGSSILTSSLDQTAILWPATKIGPSLKFSAARLEIGRAKGRHVIDPRARIFEPDTSSFEGLTMKIWLSADSRTLPNAISLSGNHSDQHKHAAEFKFAAGTTRADVEELLRGEAVSIEQPVDEPVTVHAQLLDVGGQVMSEATAVIQSADATEPASIASR
jgi:hypothetical protein